MPREIFIEHIDETLIILYHTYNTLVNTNKAVCMYVGNMYVVKCTCAVCTWYIVRGTLYVMHCTWYTVRHTLYVCSTPLNTVYITYATMD